MLQVWCWISSVSLQMSLLSISWNGWDEAKQASPMVTNRSNWNTIHIFWRGPIDFPLVAKLYYLHTARRLKMLSRGQLGNFGVCQKMVQALRFVHNRMILPRKVKQTGNIHVWQWYNLLSCLLYYNWWGFRDRKGIIIHLFSEISSGPLILIH